MFNKAHSLKFKRKTLEKKLPRFEETSPFDYICKNFLKTKGLLDSPLAQNIPLQLLYQMSVENKKLRYKSC